MGHTEIVLREVSSERTRQNMKWGIEHDDEHCTAEFVQLIEDYAGWARTMAGMSSHEKARRRLIQVAALAVAACEAIDRKTGGYSDDVRELTGAVPLTPNAI